MILRKLTILFPEFQTLGLLVNCTATYRAKTTPTTHTLICTQPRTHGTQFPTWPGTRNLRCRRSIHRQICIRVCERKRLIHKNHLHRPSRPFTPLGCKHLLILHTHRLPTLPHGLLSRPLFLCVGLIGRFPDVVVDTDGIYRSGCLITFQLKKPIVCNLRPQRFTHLLHCVPELPLPFHGKVEKKIRALLISCTVKAT